MQTKQHLYYSLLTKNHKICFNVLVKIFGYAMEGQRFESWLRCHVLVCDIILPLRPSSQADHWNTNGNNKSTRVRDHLQFPPKNRTRTRTRASDHLRSPPETRTRTRASEATICGPHRKLEHEHERATICGPHRKLEQERVRAAMCADVRSSLDPHRKLEQEHKRSTICGPHRKTRTRTRS